MYSIQYYMTLTDMMRITEVECVYCLVRAASLYKADYVSNLRC